MASLSYRTAGESHGKGILALVEGLPAGIQVDTEAINAELRRRQGGIGRGGRQRLESDQVEILTGLWRGVTIGSPVALWVANKDYRIDKLDDLSAPRPGHGDLAGAIKFLGSIRGVLERASARETVGRVAAGALAKQLLAHIGVSVLGYVVGVGPIRLPVPHTQLDELRKLRDLSKIYSLQPDRDEEVAQMIAECQRAGDTLGGIVEVRAENVPFGLGSHTQWDRKLDGRLARAVMSVQAIKGVEIGLGFEAAVRRGSSVHDPIGFNPDQISGRSLGFLRASNNAGGLEAGMSNGQPIIVRAAMKPISTLARPLPSVNLDTLQPDKADYERSDVCAIAACSVIVENVVAFEIARAVMEKFGGDHIDELTARVELFYQLARNRLESRKRRAEEAQKSSCQQGS
ncbi:MAG: chorismate synthase [Thermoguttaceae bacterium]|nr:chorismate synthase [Thermoguttaceae bacterium]MDW8078616.1 chorismate synthase [Thermoguttaceae bacterium]